MDIDIVLVGPMVLRTYLNLTYFVNFHRILDGMVNGIHQTLVIGDIQHRVQYPPILRLENCCCHRHRLVVAHDRKIAY